jgi:hypothetical protein
MAHEEQPATNPEVSHETSDVNVRGLFAFAAGLTVVGVGVYVAVWLLFLWFGAREAPKGPAEFPLAAAHKSDLPPQPRLQTDPRQDLRELRSQEDAILNSYGWVDQNNGIVRIPIDEAMKLVVQRGLPTSKKGGQR